jgi:ribosomal protein L11 methyltransferase
MPKTSHNFVSLLIEGSPEDLDAAIDFIFEAGCTGTEEMGASGIKAYFPTQVDMDLLPGALIRNFPALRCGPAETVTDEDWTAAWKKDFHGFTLGDRFFIVPSWESPPSTERIVIRIDPERAFGTGTHETTRLSLELIEYYARSGLSVVDAGTGTGILAMAAAALGCDPVTAIESDVDASDCARSNIERNHFEHAVRVQEISISEATPPPADLVVANLTESIIKKELNRITSWVRPDGVLIVSGLLVDQIDSVVDALPLSFRLSSKRTAGEWAALSWTRKRHA